MKIIEQSTNQFNVVKAHRHCVQHREELQASSVCGCFYCLKIFAAMDIQHWINEGDGKGSAALCPYCDVDAVIGDHSGFAITDEFLTAMHAHWFVESS